jgi:hypothetical protein
MTVIRAPRLPTRSTLALVVRSEVVSPPVFLMRAEPDLAVPLSSDVNPFAAQFGEPVET